MPSSRKYGESRRNILKTTGTVVGALSIAGCSGSSDDENSGDENSDGGNGAENGETDTEPVEFTFSHPWPPGVAEDGALKPWPERVKEYSDTEVNIEFVGQGQLASAGEGFGTVKEGVVEVANIPAAYYTEQLALATVSDLPLAFEDQRVGQEVAWELCQPGGLLFEEAFKPAGVRPVGVNVELQYQPFHWTDEPVYEVDDLQKLDVRSPGGTMGRTLQELGMNPVNIAGPEMYSAAERGVINSVVLSIYSIQDFSLDDFVTHWPINTNVGTVGIYSVMNEDYWQTLPEDVQDAIYKAGGELAGEYGAFQHEQQKERREIMENSGVNVYEVPADQYAGWEDIMEEVRESWGERMEEERDLPGSEAVETWDRLRAKYRKEYGLD
jgi:TRAP-type C4-dicarboxylate transport system substrate-binding protein